MAALDGGEALSDARRRGLAKAFAYFDEDANTVLDQTEIKIILKEMGMNPTDDEVHNILLHMDRNKDGKIDANEFERASDRNLAKMGIDSVRIANAEHQGTDTDASTSGPPDATGKASEALPASTPAPATTVPQDDSARGIKPPMQTQDYLLRRLFVDLCTRACQLSDEFAKFDADDQGSVMWNEFVSAVRTTNLPLADEEVQQLVNQYGDPITGRVSYQKLFSAIFHCQASHFANRKTPKQAPPPRAVAQSQNSKSVPQPLTPGVTPKRLNEIARLMQTKISERHTSLKQAFRALDTDHSGFLTTQEFAALFHNLGVTLTFKELQALVQRYDPNGDEQISYLEFVREAEVEGGGAIIPDANQNRAFPEPRIEEPPAKASFAQALRVLKGNLKQKNVNLRDIFLKMDDDRSGFITVDEFRIALDNMPILVDDDVVDQVVEVFDSNGDGQVRYDEFVAIFEE